MFYLSGLPVMFLSLGTSTNSAGRLALHTIPIKKKFNHISVLLIIISDQINFTKFGQRETLLLNYAESVPKKKKYAESYKIASTCGAGTGY